jgi:GH35 family endo-1,4-beta-xylanase
MKKRGLSLLLCALMLVQFLPCGLQSANAAATTAYSMASDSDIQGKDAGATFEGTTWLQRAGSPTLTIVDNGGVKGISVTHRTEDWHCLDLKNLTTLPNGFDYTIQVTGRTVAGTTMKLAQPASPYGTHASQVVGADGTFSLEKTFTYAELQTEKSIRIQSEGTTGDFTIDSIVITQTPAAGGGTPPDPPSDGATIDDIAITFNEDDRTQWSGAFGVSNTTNVAIEWVSDFGQGDTHALKGTHLPASTDYTGANNAIRLTFDEPLAKNAVYTISYSVYVPHEGNEGKDTINKLVGPGIVLSGDYAGATGVTKFPADFGTIDIGSWKEVYVTTPADGLTETLKSIDFRFVVNEGPRHPDVWYIDNITITQKLLDVENIEPDYKEYPALKDVYKDYFLIGTASVNPKMTGDKLDLIKYHFNTFTPENEMKPSNVQNVEDIFTYGALDEQFAKLPGFKLIGHTLAWHSQSPGWMWGTPTPLPIEEAKANMDAHIKSVLERYGASLYSIDVVNEAIADGRNDPDWKKNLRDNEGWYRALGPEWVEYAFLKAAEIVDSHPEWNCKLYYNDYNLDYADKATAVYNMVKNINEEYVDVRPNGKPLIEGIGMQGHYNQDTNPANVENSINLFSSLTGVAISVTELDITYQPNSGHLTEQQLMSQAAKYAQLFNIYKKNAAGPANGGKGRIERVTFWGTNDTDSWRAAGFPLLFDRYLRAKEAFKAVLDPEEYLGAVLPPAGRNYDQYPALKDVYRNYFMVGTVGPLTGPRSGLIGYHFNSYTPENEMKPSNVQNVKETFTFNNLNDLLSGVTALSGDIKLIGHTLTWHSQSPNWMWDASPSRYEQPGTFDKTTALANLNNHIDTVLGEYGGQLHSIDVVNEAVGTANPADWEASVNKGEGWCLALGSEWVELAFLRAAKVVDSHPKWDCKLYYNDIGLDTAAKAQTVYEMVKAINEKYPNVRPNGKPLIEGIGMQGHYNKNTKPENVENSIKLFATLPGVSVSFTELDLEWLNTGSLTPQQAVAQGQKYAQLFQVFKKYAAGPANKTSNPKVIERVTFWGSNDGDSWKSTGFPLLFNAPGGTDITAKEALVAVLNPDKYLEENPVTDGPDEEEKKPIPGVYVYDTNKGDSWSGANIILGNNAGKWPWSTAGADGKVAFIPEKDATYRITVDYTSLGTTGIRVRWLKDESNGGYTSQDAGVVGTSPYSINFNPSEVAPRIPALFNSGMENGGAYTLVTEVKLDGSQPANGLIGNIAIRGVSGGNAFLINWIKVEKIGTGGAPDRLLVNWPDGLPKAGIEGVHVYATDKGDSWSGANIILGNNAGKWPWSTAGADGKVAFTPEKDATYRIAVNYTSKGTSAIRIRWVRDESNGGYTSQDSQVVGASPSLDPSRVATSIPVYFNSGMVNGGTYTLTTEVKLDGSQPADGLIGNIAIRGGAGGNSFLINWIKVEKIGTGGTPDKLLVNWPEGFEAEPEEPGIAIPPAGQTYEAYPALKDVYKDYFTMGIFGAGEINALIHNFAAYAPGNEMKPESTQVDKGIFTYTSADNAFSNLTNRNPDMLFYGHTLAWHSQSPTWMWDAPPARYGQPGTFDGTTALANLNSHIENVLGYFGGRLKGIDVVNEAVGTANPNDWKASLAKGEGWYMALGWEWVELAFLKAAEVVDSHPEWDCKLIYNDFGLDSPNKARVVYEMVKDINERYAHVRPNGKPLIEVIGMQSHYNLTTNVAEVENSIRLFATLPGVSVNIAEMDIGCPPVGVLTPENENNQAMKFAELFQIFKKYAAGPANTTDNPKIIDRVSICGVRDATSGWRAGEFALLFTSDGLAKQALVAVLDPDTYLETHEYIDPDTEPEPEPVDGVYVYDTGRGDAWSGANIILGSDASQWPWSTAGADGKVAFTPEKDAAYRLTFNYTSTGTSSIRVRWVKDNSNNAYTDADGAVVNNYQYSASQVATTIPAYFNSGMVSMGSYTLTTEIELDGSQAANGLIGNIAIRGGGGGNAFSINWIKVEKIGAGGAADELLVSWPNVPKHKITATAGTGGTITPSGEVKVTSGASMTFVIAANSGYSIANVLVDGVSIGAVSLYTFNQVTENHTISATFSRTAPTPSGTGSQPSSSVSNTPTGDAPPANIANKPVKGVAIGTLKEALDNAEKAFKKNPGIVQASPPITLAAPPKTNSGLTPVSVPIPAGTKFTALVSPNTDGSFTPVPTYTDKNGTVYALIDEQKTLIPVTISTAFSDVSANHWFAESARAASELGIMLGNGDSTFRPNATVTNQQTVAMLMRAVGFNADYDNVLKAAAAKGIKSASGLANSGFTSRAATAVLIKDVLASLNVDVSLDKDEKAKLLAPFKDLEGLTEEEALSIAVAVKYGMLAGTYAGKDYSTMSPDTLLTRAQVAAISIRLLNFLTK